MPKYLKVTKDLLLIPNVIVNDGDIISRSTPTAPFTLKPKDTKAFAVTTKGSTSHTWTFNTSGDLVLPSGGDIVDSEGNSVFGNEFTIPDLLDYTKTADLAAVALSNSYDDLSDKPALFSGSYNDLTNKPTLFNGSYTSLTNKPTIPTAISELENDVDYVLPDGSITGNAGTVTNGVYTTGNQEIDGVKTFNSGVAIESSTGITTHQTIFNIVPTNATTVHIATAATSVSLGANTGTTVINNDLSIDGSVNISGNITFAGDSTTLSATNLSVTDAMIYLSSDNIADVLDIGIVGAYVQSATHKHTGLVRDASDGKWKLFSNIVAEPTSTVNFQGATYDTLKANLDGNVTGDVTGNVTGTVSGNAGTVTNGVYTIGDQTIGGIKTFSSTISGSINGNAGTVTNGVYTSSTYSNPSWITSLANTKITGLGTMSTQDANAVLITGGSLTGLSEVGISGGTFVLTNNSNATAFRITQTGTGNAFLVEDSASTDSTPFVIDQSGQVAIGATTALAILDVVKAGDPSVRIRNSGATGASMLFQDSDTGTSTTDGLFVGIDTNEMGYIWNYENQPLGFGTNNVEVGRFDASNRFFVGLTAIPGSVGNSLAYVKTGLTITNNGATLPYFQTYDSNAITDLKTWRFGGNDSGSFVFQTINDAYTSATDRLTINSGGTVFINTSTDSGGKLNVQGLIKASFNGLGYSSAGHEFVTAGANSYDMIIGNANASQASQYMLSLRFKSSTPNDTSARFIEGLDTTTTRFYMRSNGGLSNYSANNTNLSDEREKKDIELASNYLDKICAIPVKTFNYNDQTDEEKNLGVIAQDVQAVAPELVTETNWGTREDPKMRLSIYQTDFQFALMKSIQELKALVDAQAAEIAALKSKVN
jgi:hypothetical protein